MMTHNRGPSRGEGSGRMFARKKDRETENRDDDWEDESVDFDEAPEGRPDPADVPAAGDDDVQDGGADDREDGDVDKDEAADRTTPDDIGTGRMLGDPSPKEGTVDGCPYVLVKRTDADAVIPHSMNPGDAGFDLSSVEDVVIEPGRTRVVDTGIAVAIPRGFAGFVLSRSGLAAKNGIAVLNAPGLIDSGYRDSIRVILINTGDVAKTLKKGDRVAQLVIQRVEDPGFLETGSLPESERGENGLGSTGTSGD